MLSPFFCNGHLHAHYFEIPSKLIIAFSDNPVHVRIAHFFLGNSVILVQVIPLRRSITLPVHIPDHPLGSVL